MNDMEYSQQKIENMLHDVLLKLSNKDGDDNLQEAKLTTTKAVANAQPRHVSAEPDGPCHSS